jgi:hypothetical protein
LVDNGSIISVLLFYAIDTNDSPVSAWALAGRVPDRLKSLVFEDRTHEVVVGAIWQWAGVVDVVGADLALLLGDPFSQESSLVKPPAKALRDFS